MAYVPRTERDAAGAGGGGRARLSVLWRDPHRARGRLARAASRAAAWWSTRRSSPRSAPAWATRSRWARPASRSPARRDQRAGQRRRPHRLRPADLHPGAGPGRDPAARLRRARRVRGLRPAPGTSRPQALAERYRPGRSRPSGCASAPCSTTSGDLNDALGRLTGYLGLVGAHRAAARRDRRGERRRGVHPPAARHDRRAPLPRRERRARARASTRSRPRPWASRGSVAGAAAGRAGAAAAARPAGRSAAGGRRAGPLARRDRGSASASGFWVALVFAALPLLAVRRVPPLAALRRDVEPDAPAAARSLAYRRGRPRWRRARWRWRRSRSGAGGRGADLLGRRGRRAARALGRGVGPDPRPRGAGCPSAGPTCGGKGSRTCTGPSNQTATVVLAIGFGAFLLGTLFLVQYNLLRTLRVTGGPERPNLVLFDIQPDQLAAVQQTLAAGGYPALRPGADRADADPVAQGPAGRASRWPTPRAARTASRAHAAVGRSGASTARPTATRWWRRSGWWLGAGSRAGARETQISVERDLARELGVGVGDEIVWDVQGVPLATRVASLREVDWARFEPNFFVVFAPGALEAAPQSLRDAHAGRARGRPRGAPAAHRRAGCPTSPAWTCRRSRRRSSG